ncbi:ImmA/IrrE family metallo-endopeptidase [Demequina sediminicola]|uniref:ImmA/IrrE family metallo-endopeptidase n=1 Tax=Demequina sediminicola TaxID=1095026 RepID=UPI000785AE79|nr:hypothetical protein [Demequina sediminicola]
MGLAAVTALTWFGLNYLTDDGMPPPNERVMLDVRLAVDSGIDPTDLDAAEAYVAALPRERDDKGSYVTTGALMADAFGSHMEWHPYESYGLCSGADPGDEYFVIAAYCPLSPESFMLNSTHSSYPDYLYKEDFTWTVAHELAHKIIHARCGTVHPDFPGAETEGITNSYAVAFLGSPPHSADSAVSVSPEYAMNAATDAAAQRIQRGDCG